MNESNENNSYQESSTAFDTFNFLDIAVITMGSLALIFLGAFVLFMLADINPFEINVVQEQPLFINVGLAAIEGGALLLSIYIFGIRRRGLSWSDLGLKPTSSKWLLIAILLVILFIPIIAAIALLIQYILGLPFENPQLDFLLPDTFSWSGALGMFLLGGVIVPFAEELFFRGVLYQWLRDKTGIWIGILGSSLLFGLLHGDLSLAGATFVMGILLAWIFEKSNSLWPSITIHIVNNSIKIFLLYAFVASGISI